MQFKLNDWFLCDSSINVYWIVRYKQRPEEQKKDT